MLAVPARSLISVPVISSSLLLARSSFKFPPSWPQSLLEVFLPKAEWGTKRMCASCGARFYDFARSEVLCPACQAPYDLEQASRVRRTRMGAKAVAETEDEEVKSQTAKDTSEDEEDEEEHEFVADEEGEAEIDGDIVKTAPEKAEATSDDDDDDSEEDESLIEDASELGDDDDVNDVIESDIDKSDENT